MADLTIVVDVRNNQTMSSYSIPPSGKLVFMNNSGIDSLVISPKDGDPPLPFCENNGDTPKTLPPIGKYSSDTVKICDSFNGEYFLYTAQIGQAAAEDPIVIIEKSKMNYWDPGVAAVAGALIGAGITYFIVRSRDSRKRPQQG
jgi:hypothetical protein